MSENIRYRNEEGKLFVCCTKEIQQKLRYAKECGNLERCVAEYNSETGEYEARWCRVPYKTEMIYDAVYRARIIEEPEKLSYNDLVGMWCYNEHANGYYKIEKTEDGVVRIGNRCPSRPYDYLLYAKHPLTPMREWKTFKQLEEELNTQRDTSEKFKYL